jgi:photosystem II stability/assembly factor-like uncharacterized protein/pimeloyl-ACP methyl ester carboxylesterase
MRAALLSVVSLLAAGAAGAEPPKKVLPLDGEVFEVSGRTAFLIPAEADPHAAAKPWVWYAPTLPNLPGPEERWMFERFRAAGVAVAGIDAGESYGSPAGNKVFDALYAAMTARGYSAKPVLLGRSRGGLMALSWAAANPDKVGGFAGIYPVCDLASYPGVARAAGAFELKPDELKTRLNEFNPADRLDGLAKAKVPLFAIHGDADKVVTLEANSGRVKERYAALGGSMTLVVPPGQGHTMWPGFFQCPELVDFVIARAGVGLALDAPQDYQVVQRDATNAGAVRVRGKLGEPALKADALEYRVGTKATPGEWRKLDAGVKDGRFDATAAVPAGGWYRFDVRATAGGRPVAAATVERVGVGEVFVVAGQSNSANHGAEKQTTKTGRVAAFDGARWQPANDPQPGASGGGGSFLPPLGDAVAEKFGVPVGFVACGVGATSVREWLPKGATFPNPPTIEGNVRKRADGSWESKGDLYAALVARMKPLGPNGFRAVLWHQGESDANQTEATRTLPGKLYREHLERLIRESRKEIGWEAPWFVAQASYHGPGDEGSPEIRAAQAALWKDGVALEGPDSDALRGEFRDGGGKGVHFSGPGLRAHAAKWAEKVAPWLEGRIATHDRWRPQAIDTDADFRGLCAAGAGVAWVSGTKGTFGRTTDGGKTWAVGTVPGAEKLDFRDVEAFGADTAYLMSAGPGEESRIYKTIDGGKRWALQFKNAEPKAFLDALAFWDERHGIALSDPVNDRFYLLTTDDGGKTWAPLPEANRPAALPGEGAFAASGTCLVTRGENDVWFCTGGAKTARVFRSADRGKTWAVSEAPLAAGAESAGGFSIAFRDRDRGVLVGGDYRKPDATAATVAVTADGGKTWQLVEKPLPFRSCVVWAKDRWVAAGTTGSDASADGTNWNPLDREKYNGVSFTATGDGWAVGPKGRIAKFVPADK